MADLVIVGKYSGGPSDVGRNHDRYLAEAFDHDRVRRRAAEVCIGSWVIGGVKLNRGGLGVHSPLDRLRKPVSVEPGGLTLTERLGESPVGKL